ncbi:MAG: TonB family protein [Alphaproteobacteria bacterium]|nr:TonB family protein [Alphaproteobacteria bacterium]
MSDQTPHDPKGIHHAKATQIHDSRGATVGKWLAGAAVAALVLGGGYYAVKNLPANNDQNTEIAAYDSQSTGVAPYTAGPVSSGVATTESTSASPNVSSNAGSSSPSTANRARARTAQNAEVVPEQVVGITPVSATTDSEELVITGVRRPVWVSTPSARRLSAMYPARALEREREGEASVRCVVQNGGALDCTRVSETPERSGFGNAALRVARTFKHAPQRADGSSATGTPVNLRVMFRIEDDRRRT